MIELTCCVCGRTFRRWRSQIMSGRGKTCSATCRVVYVAERIKRPVAERLWEAVDKTPTCWIWTGGKRGGGYGVIWHDGRLRPAHVVAWELVNGKPAPEGLDGLHKCDNPPCVRPDHIFFGTDADNVADMIAKDRHARGTRNGQAKLDDTDVVWIRYWRSVGESSRDIAKAFGVCRELVDGVVRGVRWKHVT